MATKSRVMKTSDESLDYRHKFSVSKKILVEDNQPRQRVQASTLEQALESITTKGNESKSIQEILPDLMLVKEVLVSSIINPKDFTHTELDISVKIRDLDEAVLAELNDLISTHFRDVYNLSRDATKIIGEALFDYGSYSLAILPPSVIEGVIDDGRMPGIESFGSLVTTAASKKSEMVEGRSSEKLMLSFSDNVELLGMPEVRQKLMVNSSRRRYGIESLRKKYDVEGGLGRAEGSIAAGTESEYELAERVRIKAPKKLTTDNFPLVKRIPSDCVIPIHEPGDVSKQLAFYVVLDENGYPASRIQDSDHAEALSKMRTSSQETIMSMASNLGLGSEVKTSKSLTDEYIRQVNIEINNSLKNGLVGDTVEVGSADEVYMLMLARALSKKKTRLLYFDKELFTYIAYSYNQDGVGESLLERTKLYSALRATLMFSDIITSVKNSAGLTELNIQLDEDDPDPAKTIQLAIAEYINMQNDSIPLDVMSPVDTIRSIQRAGIVVNVEGNEVFPSTKTSLEDRSRDKQTSDGELDDKLRKAQYNAMGVPPEIIDSIFEGDFATGIVNSNKMLARRIAVYQKLTEWFFSDHIQKYVRWSGTLRASISEIIAKVKDINVDDVIDSLSVNLPEPDTAKTAASIEALEQYRSLAELVVSNYISEDMLGDLFEGDSASKGIDNVREMMVSSLVRDWLRRQNIMPEMDELMSSETAGGFKERMSSHLDILSERLNEVSVFTLKLDHKGDKKYQAELDRQEKEDEEEEARKEAERLAAEEAAAPEEDDTESSSMDEESTDETESEEGDTSEEDIEATDEVEDESEPDPDSDMDFKL